MANRPRRALHRPNYKKLNSFGFDKNTYPFQFSFQDPSMDIPEDDDFFDLAVDDE